MVLGMVAVGGMVLGMVGMGMRRYGVWGWM